MCKVRARKWRGAHAGWLLCVRRAGERAGARMWRGHARARIASISHFSCDGDGGRVVVRAAEVEEDGGNGEGGEAQRVVNGGGRSWEGGGGGGDGGKGTLPAKSIWAAREVAAARRAVWVAVVWR